MVKNKEKLRVSSHFVYLLNSIAKNGAISLNSRLENQQELIMAETKTANASKTTPLKPLGNRVLVKRLEAEKTLKGGIILPDTAQVKQEQVEVIAVGDGKKDDSGKLIPMPVKVGDIVLMEKYAGQEVTLDDQEYTIIKADDLIAIIEK